MICSCFVQLGTAIYYYILLYTNLSLYIQGYTWCMVVYVGTYWYIMVHYSITQYIAVLVGILKIQKMSITLRFRTQYLSHTNQHTQRLSYERCFLGLNKESRRYIYCFFAHNTLFHLVAGVERPAPAPQRHPLHHCISRHKRHR